LNPRVRRLVKLARILAASSVTAAVYACGGGQRVVDAGSAATLDAQAPAPNDAGGDRRTVSIFMPRDSGAPEAAVGAGFVISRDAPDPEPLRVTEAWITTFVYDGGSISMRSVRKELFTEPKQTPRNFGRFALELFEGAVLVERVRFDFPLLGADPIDAGVRLETKLKTEVGVFFPSVERGDRLELHDRKTGKRISLPWPPTATQ
jgi:hypothetical protein